MACGRSRDRWWRSLLIWVEIAVLNIDANDQATGVGVHANEDAKTLANKEGTHVASAFATMQLALLGSNNGTPTTNYGTMVGEVDDAME